MSANLLERTTFEISRAAEYFDARELQAQTGQPSSRFAEVAIKELVDNALDACETAGIAPQIAIALRDGDGLLRLSVTDNGAGLPSGTVSRILNFDTRTSDKINYRAPTRGLQGNGLKTVLGMPYALGSSDQTIVIESQGVRHTISASTDFAGELRIQPAVQQIENRPGTRIAITLPVEDQELRAEWLIRSFALFNPHASVRSEGFEKSSKHANSEESETSVFYQPSVEFPAAWQKFLPTDATSPWWYDLEGFRRLIFAHINHTRRGGADLTVRDFVRQFRGLSGTAKAKAVCSRLPSIPRLSDFEKNPEEVDRLWKAVREFSKPAEPKILGLVGEGHLRDCIDRWYGVRRWWYAKEMGDLDGIPFVFETAIAETRDASGEFFHGVNFSPTYDDPLHALLQCREFSTYSLTSFLSQAHCDPSRAQHVTAIAHLVCPSLEFLDRGKTRLNIPQEMADGIAKPLWRVSKTLYREEERRRKDAVRWERQWRREDRYSSDEQTLKDAVFEVLPEAVNLATGDGEYPVSARTLFYQVRPLIQSLTSKELDYTYFSQELLSRYREEFGPIKNLYYDPRGVLYEPHTGNEVALGTREVENYTFPEWRYDKILYVEKKGLWPILQATRLAERYDMAIIAAEGYATEAARTLFAGAEKDHDYQLFVLHDADPHGYNIARTLSVETRRMPGHRVQVTDLGLKIEEALELGLQAEEFTRKKQLPIGLDLSETERKHFEGRVQGRSWICRRVELNAFRAPDLVAYIERKLTEAGAATKVIPSAGHLPRLVKDLYGQEIDRFIDSEIATLLEPIKRQIGRGFQKRIPLDEARSWIERGLQEDPALPWNDAAATELRRRLAKQTPEIRKLLCERLVAAIQATA